MEHRPFTHLKDKETDAAKADSRQMLPVVSNVVPLQLILKNKAITLHKKTKEHHHKFNWWPAAAVAPTGKFLAKMLLF